MSKNQTPVFKGTGPHLGLTNDEFARLTTAVGSTWGAIADDLGEPGGDGYTRDEVVELVFDADRIRTYGNPSFQRSKQKEWEEFYDNTIRPWLNANYGSPDFNKLMKKLFPHSHYE